MLGQVLVMVLVVLAATQSLALGATWRGVYVRALPDSAFAAIERTPEGQRLRRLPHHDATGSLDIPHLCNALARLPQVKWRDPANAETARRHLKAHVEEVGQGACRPGARSTNS